MSAPWTPPDALLESLDPSYGERIRRLADDRDTLLHALESLLIVMELSGLYLEQFDAGVAAVKKARRA
jgi:hypothetical protein